MASGIDEVIKLMKDKWPKFPITRENLLHPKQELVIRFYKAFIDDFNEKIAHFTGISAATSLNLADCDPEEQIFKEISKILGDIFNVEFMPSDIYEPTPIRTKNFFTVCLHFASYTDCLADNIIGTEVYEFKQETKNLLLKQQALLDEINTNAKTKGEICEKLAVLEQEYKTTKNAHDTIKVKIIALEKLKDQIQVLNLEFDNQDCERKRLENVEKDFLEQRVTEREYQNWLNSIEQWKKESEMLDDVNADMGDGLQFENDTLQRVHDCMSILSKFHFDIENLETLIQNEHDLKSLLNEVDTLVKTKLNPMEQQKLENEQKLQILKEKLVAVQNEYTLTMTAYTSTLDEYSKELDKLKTKVDDECKNKQDVVLELEKEIKTLAENLDKMRKTFMSEYIKVSNAEKIVADKFKEVLVKIKESEE